MLQRELGCKLPGFNYTRRRSPVTFMSPLLVGDPQLRVMTECPLGYLERNAPWVYDALEMASLVENATPTEFAQLPRFIQRAARVRSAELARQMEAERKQRQNEADGRRGASVRRSSRKG